MQRNKLKALGHIAQKHLETDKEWQKGHHDEGLKSKELNAEDQVLLLLPGKESILQTKWQGPYTVESSGDCGVVWKVHTSFFYCDSTPRGPKKDKNPKGDVDQRMPVDIW